MTIAVVIWCSTLKLEQIKKLKNHFQPLLYTINILCILNESSYRKWVWVCKQIQLLDETQWIYLSLNKWVIEVSLHGSLNEIIRDVFKMYFYLYVVAHKTLNINDNISLISYTVPRYVRNILQYILRSISDIF